MNKNCFSYWFPNLVGIPVPKTRIVSTTVKLEYILDGHAPDGLREFLDTLKCAAKSNGFPCFLRTGQGSGKHQWSETCLVPNVDSIESHVYNLVEWSHLVHIMGLPHDVWVIREMLPVEPVICLPNYHGFPLVRECRAFIKDGEVRCLHPYWPTRAVEEGFKWKKGGDAWDDNPVRDLPAHFNILVKSVQAFDRDACLFLASKVAALFQGDGAWSVDLLETTNGYYVTDMALASESYHWDDCLNKAEFQKG